MVEGARLESVCTLTRTVGSNPTLSASYFSRFTQQIARIEGETDSLRHLAGFARIAEQFGELSRNQASAISE